MSAKSRFESSMVFGAVAAGALTLYEATKRHAVFAAAAARPAPAGQHVSAAVILAVGFAATAVVVTVATFVVTTILAARRGQRAQRRSAQPRQARARRGYGGVR
jgi:hypothetical protein